MVVASGWAAEVIYRPSFWGIHTLYIIEKEEIHNLRTQKDLKILHFSITFRDLFEVLEEHCISCSFTRKIYPNRLEVAFNFLNQLTILDLRLCRRFQSPDELPTGLQAMDASNTMSLVWIFTWLNWELSKQLQCPGCSKVLKKNRTSNPKNKLLNVSLLSLFLFDQIWFLDHNSLLMILMY